MNYSVYHIVSDVLKNKVQYILFNKNEDPTGDFHFTSFANTNYCLGICRNAEWLALGDNSYRTKYQPGLHAYVSGIYLQPARFNITGTHDEICIDFTPVGYYHFFPFAPKDFISDRNLLQEIFGNMAYHFFEQVFSESNLQKRGMMIESFLLRLLRNDTQLFLCNALYNIHKSKAPVSVALLAKKMQCSERKLHRIFTSYLDISPKNYIKVARFRKALHLLGNTGDKAAAVAYELNFADQSHLIREIKEFTGITPKHIPGYIHSIDNTVLIGHK